MKKALLYLILATLPLAAQTLPAAVPMPSAIVQFVDSNGIPLAGGKLYTCFAGLTCSLTSPPSNAQATYTDSTAAVQNTNPIVLDSAGRAQVWIGANAYKLVLANAANSLVWTQDNVSDTTLFFVNYVKTVGTASLITYTAPYTGAAGRSLTTKLSETVSVSDFAGSDLGAQLNAALSALSSTGEIDIPAVSGGWTITTPVVITTPNYLRIHCLGDKGGPVLIHDGVTGNPSEPMIKIVGNTANTGDIMIDGCRFQGNGLTGGGGNGHALALISNPVGSFGPIRVTLRDDAFYSFAGTGKDVANVPIGAAGLYASNGHIIISQNTDYVQNQYGMYLDSCFKCTVLGGDFDTNIHNGIMLKTIPTGYIGPSENIEILAQAIFNANGSGGATDGGIYATNFYHLDINNDRFKIQNPSDIITGPDDNVGVVIEDNHFFHGLTYGAHPAMDLNASSGNVRVCGNSEFVDFQANLSVWLKLQDAGGNHFLSPVICSNKAILSQESGTPVDKWIWIGSGAHSVTLQGNEFGDNATPGGALAELVNNVYYIDAPDVVMIANSCTAAATVTITNCIYRTVNASPFWNISPTYNTDSGGVITNHINEAAALAGPRVLWEGGKFAVGSSIGPPTIAGGGLELQGTFSSPSTSGTSPNGTFGMATSPGNNAYWGCYGAGPFACWWQAQSIAALGTFFPIAINPLGGGVTIGLGNAAPATGLSLDLALPLHVVPVAAASLPACVAGLEGTWATVTNANSAVFNAALVGGGANHVAAYCNGSGWTVH